MTTLTDRSRACRCLCTLLASVLSLTLLTPAANAFDGLNAAQKLVFIDYRYTSEHQTGERVEDDVKLTILAAVDNERRDLSVEFLSDDRQMSLPTFEGYRGNPVIIAMLEHIAQTLSAETGGGALYFRNRIRDAMASEQAELLDIELAIDGQEPLVAQQLSFKPFANDAYLGAREQFAAATVSIVVSDGVPAGIVSIGVESADDNNLFFKRELVIAN